MSDQPSLFDITAQLKRDQEIAQKLDEEIKLLAERKTKAEAWLNLPASKSDPRYPKAQETYSQILEEHARKVIIRENRKELRCVVLQMPPGVKYQPAGANEMYDQLRVLFQGEPARPDELTLGGFLELMETVGMINSAMK